MHTFCSKVLWVSDDFAFQETFSVNCSTPKILRRIRKKNTFGIEVLRNKDNLSIIGEKDFLCKSAF